MFMLPTYGTKNPNRQMKKIICVICFLIGVIVAVAQEEKTQYIRKGLIRSQGTIAPGILLKGNTSTISLYGTFEGYISNYISLRGDSYFYVKGKDNSGNDPFEFNHSTFSGASYHFKTKNHFDPYFAIEPGISITKQTPPSLECTSMNPHCPATGNTSFNPLFSSALGFNFYFQKWFHLFGEARYLSGKHLSEADTPLSLNELRFAFGLGFNLNLLKKK